MQKVTEGSRLQGRVLSVTNYRSTISSTLNCFELLHGICVPSEMNKSTTMTTKPPNLCGINQIPLGVFLFNIAFRSVCVHFVEKSGIAQGEQKIFEYAAVKQTRAGMKHFF